MENDSATNGNGFANQIYGNQETSNVHVFKKYMLNLLDYNPQWLGSKSPEWCNDIKISNSLHVTKALEWAEKDKANNKTRSESLLNEAPITISVNDMFGRHLVANRLIKGGEMIIAEPPLVLSLKARSPPYCSTCHSKVDGKFACSDCGFFFCRLKCIDESHREECQILKKLGLGQSEEDKAFYNKTMQDRLEAMPADQRARAQEMINTAQDYAWKKQAYEVLQHYSIIPTVRTLITIGQSEQQRDLIMALAVHVAKGNFRYRANQKGIVNVIINKLQVSTDPDLIHHIAAVWDTNAFEVPLDQGTKVNGIYPFASLMTHNCKANAQQWFTGSNGILILRAIEDIQEGSMITTCYTDPQWGTRLRQDHLKVSKQFICNCDRCIDPTENGTFTGSVLCQQCLGPMISPEPLNAEATWKCGNDCGHSLTAKEVRKLSKSYCYRCEKCGSDMEATNPMRLHYQWYCTGGCGHTSTFYKLLNESGKMSASLLGLDSSKITETASVTEELKSRLHPNHFVLTQLHWSRIKTYSLVNLKDLQDEELDRLTDTSTLLLGIIQKLEAPFSRLHARIVREYVRSRCEQLRRLQEKGNNIEKYLDDLGLLIGESSVVLGWDDGWMPPAKVLIEAYEELKLPHNTNLLLNQLTLSGEH